MYDFFITVATIIFLCLPLFWFAYQWVFNALGWSPGKRVRSITVEKDTGAYLLPHPGPPRAGSGFVRTIGQAIGVIPSGLGYWWALWDSQKQAWHDKLAGTHVMKAVNEEEIASMTTSAPSDSTHSLKYKDERFSLAPPSRRALFRSLGVWILYFLVVNVISSRSLLPWKQPIPLLVAFGFLILVIILSSVRSFRFLRGNVTLNKKGIAYPEGQSRGLIRWADVNSVTVTNDGAVIVRFTQRHWFRSPTEETVSFDVESPSQFAADVRMRAESVKGSEVPVLH